MVAYGSEHQCLRGNAFVGDGGRNGKCVAGSRGLSTRDIQAHIEELYGIGVSAALVSAVTDAVFEEVRAWQHRPPRVAPPPTVPSPQQSPPTDPREGAIRVMTPRTGSRHPHKGKEDPFGAGCGVPNGYQHLRAMIGSKRRIIVEWCWRQYFAMLLTAPADIRDALGERITRYCKPFESRCKTLFRVLCS